jgi:O-antigen/teichoic acid export membrane protein
MFWVGVSFGLTCVTQPMEARLASFGNSRRLIPPQLIGAVSTLVLAFFFVPKNGALGAAQARAVACVIQGLATALVLFLAKSDSKSAANVDLQLPDQ